MCQNQSTEWFMCQKRPKARNTVNKERPLGRARKLKHTKCFSPTTSYLAQNKGLQLEETKRDMIVVIWLTRECHIWVTLKSVTYEIVLNPKKHQEGNLRLTPVFKAVPSLCRGENPSIAKGVEAQCYNSRLSLAPANKNYLLLSKQCMHK